MPLLHGDPGGGALYRGRANLLRAALSGQLPPGTITSQRLYQALDLCLECKGCKSECQSGVDMAKLKYEFLDHYYKANGMPLRNRVLAHINQFSSLGSRMAPFSNWAAGNPFGRFLASALLGIHPQRKPPPFAGQSFPQWFRSRPEGATAATRRVVLFNDTFMNYNYPQVGKAAVELLEAAGFLVQLANARCCGRPMISKGLLDEATSHARFNVDLLHPYAEQGIPIVGCEPSCLLTFKDEYPELLRNEKSRQVAEHCHLIDDFLMRLQDRGELGLKFKDLTKKVLFHGHCHQKALVGTANSMRALRLPPGFQVEQVRAKGPEWEIAVMGISCRQQIEHGTGRKARHLVEVLRGAIP